MHRTSHIHRMGPTFKSMTPSLRLSHIIIYCHCIWPSSSRDVDPWPAAIAFAAMAGSHRIWTAHSRDSGRRPTSIPCGHHIQLPKCIFLRPWSAHLTICIHFIRQSRSRDINPRPTRSHIRIDIRKHIASSHRMSMPTVIASHCHYKYRVSHGSPTI